jgi:purine-binding chemotaxis protein CheW
MQYCTFKVDHLLIGIEVWRVQEVIRNQPMTFVPLAPREVRGLINLRGQIVTAIDVRHRLGLPCPPDGSAPMNAVIRLDDEVVSLLVDEAGEVVEPSPESYEPVPSTASPQIRAMCTGTFKLEGSLLLVLDTDSVGRIAADPDGLAARRAS